MLKLGNIRAGNIDKRLITLDNAARDERSHAQKIVLHPNTFKVTTGEDQSPKVLIDRLQERLGGCKTKSSIASVLIPSIAVHSNAIPEICFASTAESLDCKDITFFHALIRTG